MQDVIVVKTFVRMQGGQLLPYPLPAQHAPYLAESVRHCPSCGERLDPREELVVVPLGPGRVEAAQIAQRQGQWFDSCGVVCHRACVGAEPVLGIAGKVATAARLLDVAADEVEVRAKGLPTEYDPTPEIRKVAASVEQMSHDVSGYEDRIL